MRGMIYLSCLGASILSLYFVWIFHDDPLLVMIWGFAGYCFFSRMQDVASGPVDTEEEASR